MLYIKLVWDMRNNVNAITLVEKRSQKEALKCR